MPASRVTELLRRALVSALACVVVAAQAAAATPIAEPDLASVEQALFERSNTFRRLQGRAPMLANPVLAATAQAFADFMARTDRYGHEADGRQPVQRAAARGYRHCMVAENIAYQYHSAGFETQDLARRFLQGWIESPGHRGNLLAEDATETAVAVARSPGSGRYYAVQLFGRPAALRTRFVLSNHSSRSLQYRIDGKPFPLAPGATRWHEQCTQPELDLQLPGQAEPTTLQPAPGRSYRIEASGDRVQVVSSGS